MSRLFIGFLSFLAVLGRAWMGIAMSRAYPGDPDTYLTNGEQGPCQCIVLKTTYRFTGHRYAQQRPGIAHGENLYGGL